MQFSIITPSFRNSDWLKLCVASVADQEGVTLEHIVQDSVSNDGTLDWLPQDPRVTAYVEKDAGMYDAVNRGLRRAKGEFLAYLNCDEQYLPDALRAVHDYFQTHPAIDVVFADTIVIDPSGGFIACRKAVRPLKHHVWASHLPTFTCATFFRRNLIDKHQLYFDTRWRDVGDADWVLRLLGLKIKTGILRYYTSAFTQTGENMNFKPNALHEKKELHRSAPVWMRTGKHAIVMQHRLRKLAAGAYSQKPFQYAVYTKGEANRRTVVDVPRPAFLLR
jgi:glycosyltransferase involved in cell wall biosynthesis